MKKVYKLIIDTDPGVDDVTALTFVLNDPQFDVKLLTVGNGNIHLKHAVRNTCHLIEILNKDIPIVAGYEERLGGSEEYAYNVHGKEGFGNYIPPKETVVKPIEKDCADAMYEVVKRYPHQVTVVILGTHTNFAHMLLKHPDAKNLVKQVIMMGGSLCGIKTDPNHRSFNIRTDAPAFKVTVDSRIPVVMCPSRIGRDVTYFTENQVEKIAKANPIGKFLRKTFETYWEPNYPEKIIATCDLSAIYYLTHPEMYRTKKAFIDVDIETNIGATVGHFDKKGYFKVVETVNRNAFLKMIFQKLHEMNGFKFTNQTVIDNIKGTIKQTSENETKSQKTGEIKKVAKTTPSKATAKKVEAKPTAKAETKNTAKAKSASQNKAKETKTSENKKVEKKSAVKKLAEPKSTKNATTEKKTIAKTESKKTAPSKATTKKVEAKPTTKKSAVTKAEKTNKATAKAETKNTAKAKSASQNKAKETKTSESKKVEKKTAVKKLAEPKSTKKATTEKKTVAKTESKKTAPSKATAKKVEAKPTTKKSAVTKVEKTSKATAKKTNEKVEKKQKPILKVDIQKIIEKRSPAKASDKKSAKEKKQTTKVSTKKSTTKSK